MGASDITNLQTQSRDVKRAEAAAHAQSADRDQVLHQAKQLAIRIRRVPNDLTGYRCREDELERGFPADAVHLYVVMFNTKMRF